MTKPTNDEHNAPISDRLSAIRARLKAATPGQGPWRADADFQSDNPTLRVITGTYPDTVRMVAATLDAAETKFIAHAPADVAWLLDEVERLRNTNPSLSKPFRTENGTVLLPDSRFHAPVATALPHDDSVVQGVTKLECSDG